MPGTISIHCVTNQVRARYFRYLIEFIINGCDRRLFAPNYLKRFLMTDCGCRPIRFYFGTVPCENEEAVPKMNCHCLQTAARRPVMSSITMTAKAMRSSR